MHRCNPIHMYHVHGKRVCVCANWEAMVVLRAVVCADMGTDIVHKPVYRAWYMTDTYTCCLFSMGPFYVF